MAPEKTIKIIGIRPGEKLHEVMCPKDDSHLTLEFESHFVIKPSFVFDDSIIDFSESKLGEKGKLVAPGFEYNSENNNNFLTIDEIKSVNSVI